MLGQKKHGFTTYEKISIIGFSFLEILILFIQYWNFILIIKSQTSTNLDIKFSNQTLLNNLLMVAKTNI